MGRIRNLWVLFGLVLFAVSVCDFHVSADVIPSENECRPYIEKAIHELKNVEATGSDDDKESNEANLDKNASIENEPGTEDDGNDSKDNSAEDGNQSDDNEPSQENQTEENENASAEEPEVEQETVEDVTQENDSKEDNNTAEDAADEKSAEDGTESGEKNEDADGDSKEEAATDGDSKEDNAEGDSKEENAEADSKEGDEADSQEPEAADSKENDDGDSKENAPEDGNDSKDNEDNDSTQTEENQDQDSGEPAADAGSEQANDSGEKEGDENATESVEDGENQTVEDQGDSKEDDAAAADDTNEEDSVEEKVLAKRSIPDDNAQDDQESAQNDDNDSQENANDSTADNDKESQENTAEDDGKDSQEGAEGAESVENDKESQENVEGQEDTNESQENAEGSQENSERSQENAEGSQENDEASQEGSEQESTEGEADEEEQEPMPEEDLTMEFEIPKNLRPRGHVSDLLGLDAESSIKENALKRTGDVVLKELKKVFDNAIHPLEATYKYRDLSNRHFGDPEIFSKPLVLFMGPWSGGKSTILNYLTDNEYTPNSIRSGAEPSPAYFNILMHGDEPEVLDGTQLAADWTFSGLQKFGQGLMDRLRGQKLPSKLLERVNIVEIPGILEVRKQVSKYFPFNDACQWFIDRADIIFLVYDPSKLDVGPETEAILDQLKGREYQTRILLNKADQVKPEELLRVQGALIWNISPLMSSAQPPVMYTVSLWSHPFENGAPIRLLQAQERAFLTDLREAIDKRIENKIASARRFAVRIRNHAKMVDCYLTTYYNQKGLFSNKKQVSDKIIEHPQNYNIYEGLSTLTNISRYDLPDPEVYMDFFRLNPLYEFKKLAETCTYFKGCPINKLDIAIAYDLPELVGKYKKQLEQNLQQLRKEYDENCNQTEIDPPVKIINSR